MYASYTWISVDSKDKKRLKVFFSKLAKEGKKTFIEFLYLKAGQCLQVEKLLGTLKWNELMLTIEEIRLQKLKTIQEENLALSNSIKELTHNAQELIKRETVIDRPAKIKPGKKTRHKLNSKLERITDSKS